MKAKTARGDPKMKRLRRRLENSRALAEFLAFCVGSYLRLANRTTRWEVEGLDALRRDLAQGPVLLIVWHQRLLMGPLHWPVKVGPLSSLYDSSPIGRVSGAMQRQFGLQAMQMAHKTSNLAASREVMRRVRSGISVGITADGPLGPAFVLKDSALDWARAMGCPVYSYAFSHSRQRRLDTWDTMILPRLFGRGRYVFRRWPETPTRRPDSAELARLRRSLGDFLDETATIADRPLTR